MRQLSSRDALALGASGAALTVTGWSTSASAAESSDPLPQSLAGVTLICSGHLLPLLYVSPGQINFQVSSDLGPGEYRVEVHRSGVAPVLANMTVVRNAPGLLIAAHPDGNPVTAILPAHPGETLLTYGTGFGPTQPAAFDGFHTPAMPPVSWKTQP